MSKQTDKWKIEIADLEKSIPVWEGWIKDHQQTLLKDMTIGFYEIDRRQKAAAKLMSDISAAKKRISTLKSKL